MHRPLLITAAVLGAVTVALGAFGAHSLRELVPEKSVASFETGVRYQFYHVFAIFLTAIIYGQYPVRMLRIAARCFITGIILFSGSLYLMTAFQASGETGLSGIGFITPVGGLFFIAGWLLLAGGIAKSKR